MMQYDLIVIGGGPGGYPAALYAAGHGLKTALFEQKELGGTCLNRGCIPTKALLHSTEQLREMRTSPVFEGMPQLNVSGLYEKKDSIVSGLREGIGKQLAAAGVEVINGHAVIRDGHTVVCEGTEYSTENILIASGSVPAALRISGITLPGVIDSDRLFADLPEHIGKLTIVGGGVIGCEMASVFAELGSEVTVLEYQPYLLPLMDREIGRSLQPILKKRNINVQCGAEVYEIVQDGEALNCHYRVKGKEQSVQADLILVCTGRKADLTDLFEDPGLVESDRGIIVDDSFRTTAEGIWAVGDVINGSIKLAHAAEAQSLYAAALIAGQTPQTDPKVIPACVYTSPEIASVGMTQEEAKEKGLDVLSKKATMSANARSLIAEAERGFIKIVYDRNGKLLGAHLMCERASDMIAEYTTAIVNGLTVGQLASAVRPHPSFCEAASQLFLSAAQELQKQ
ncbi:MAG: dihydrolipoyl dehydrogenase [Erysipelotrichaceae bacterium]|nr:dihydrolipoyl dehydrogenase [Erysipelotrichaceae bacterium]